MTYRDEDEEIIDTALDTLAWQRREIERLRGALEAIADGEGDAQVIARAALGDGHD